MDRTMVELGCAVYGEGSTFYLEIARDTTVQKLQEAIFEKKRFGEKYTLDASDLKLYLARKPDGTWLKEGPELRKHLRAGKKEEEYEEMYSSWTLSEDYLGPDFQPREEDIHILVELSTTPVASGSSASAALDVKDVVAELLPQIKAAVSEALAENAEKQSVYSLSDLNSDLGERLKRKMGLRERWLTAREPANASIPKYNWIPHVADSEQTQRTSYMAYLRMHLKPLLDREDFHLVDVAQDESLLKVKDPRLPFELNGTADVLLVNRYTEECLNKLAGIRLVIELKKEVDASNLPQALGQLLSSSLKAPEDCYPMVLLTDLNSNWNFSWFNEERVLTFLTLKHPKNAFDFIVAAVTAEERETSYQVPFVDGSPPLKKLKVNDFLPMPSDAADEMMERYELMADVLEPEFLQARRLEYAQHLVQSMPAYAHMYP